MTTAMPWGEDSAVVAATADGDEMFAVAFGREWRYFVRSREGAILGSGAAATCDDAMRMAGEVVAIPFGGDA